MAVLQNITSVRRAEETARERLAEIESIYRNAPVGLSFIDADLRYLRVNQAIADMNGVSIDQVVGKTYRDLSPDTADAAEPFLRDLIRRGEPVRNLETVSRPPADPAEDHHYLLNMEPVRNEQGEIIGHMTAVQDVTELRRAERAATQRLSELEILYENTPTGLCRMDPDLCIIHLNPLFAQLCERPIRQLAGAAVVEVLPPKIAGQLLPQLEYVRHSGASSASLQIRGPVPGSAQREYTWIAHSHPTRSPDGEVTGLVTVLQDITALADRQREIETVVDRLAEAQRVAQLGSFDWNLIDDEVWWSREMFAISGQPMSYLPTYDSFFELVHPADREKVRQQTDATLADGNPARVTFRLLHPDGTTREIFGVARLDRTEDGLPARMVGTWQDVTEFGEPRPRGRSRNHR
jgi:PAS domain S-box-containing protein